MSKRGVGERELPDERAEHVVRLEPDHARDTGRTVPVLHRPAAGGGDEGQRRIGVDRVWRADAGQQRHVEDAVAAGMAVGQVDPVLLRPGPHGAQLARAPDEAFVEAPRVATVLDLVRGGDQVVEADGLGERPNHVGRRRRRQDQPVTLGPEGGQTLRGERGDDVAQGGDRPAAGRRTCSWCQPLATRAAARTRPMDTRFSPRRSLTA